MCLTSLSSICPPYRNRSNYLAMDEEIGVRQPLVDTAHADRLSTTTDQLLSYVGEQMDSTGHGECLLSIGSSIMAVIILCFHGFEKYHENHKEILGTQILNIIIITSIYMKSTLSCSASSIKWSKKTARWLSPNRASEQRIVLASASRIAQQPTNCLWPAIKWWARLDNNYYYLHDILRAGAFITAAAGFLLHVIEKKHDNHIPMLWLEGANVCLNVFLTAHDLARIGVQKWGQPSLLPQNVIRMTNYHTI